MSKKQSNQKSIEKSKYKFVHYFNNIDESWYDFFHTNDEFRDHIIKINEFLMNEMSDGKTVLPQPHNLVFNAFNQCKLNKLKVVIIGQDPYFSNVDEAMGLSFSVPDGVSIPPSLRNIFAELLKDENIEDFVVPKSGDLTKWAQQGVLLLNTALTVIHKNREAHMASWDIFTKLVIKKICKNTDGVIFMLWGNYAKKFQQFVTANHICLTSVHPSPMSANRGGWFDNKHFSKANEILKKNKKKTIDWCL
jgi:uracil-DNA glycosylase